jgi:hypothetical protein
VNDVFLCQLPGTVIRVFLPYQSDLTLAFFSHICKLCRYIFSDKSHCALFAASWYSLNSFPSLSLVIETFEDILVCSYHDPAVN